MFSLSEVTRRFPLMPPLWLEASPPPMPLPSDLNLLLPIQLGMPLPNDSWFQILLKSHMKHSWRWSKFLMVSFWIESIFSFKREREVRNGKADGIYCMCLSWKKLHWQLSTYWVPSDDRSIAYTFLNQKIYSGKRRVLNWAWRLTVKEEWFLGLFLILSWYNSDSLW